MGRRCDTVAAAIAAAAATATATVFTAAAAGIAAPTRCREGRPATPATFAAAATKSAALAAAAHAAAHAALASFHRRAANMSPRSQSPPLRRKSPLPPSCRLTAAISASHRATHLWLLRPVCCVCALRRHAARVRVVQTIYVEVMYSDRSKVFEGRD